MIASHVSSVLEALRRCAFLEGSDWRRDNRSIPLSDIERDVLVTFGAECQPVRDRVCVALRTLSDLVVSQLPRVVSDDLAECGECEEVTSLPFFCESFLYPLVGKEDARTILALLRQLKEAAGFTDAPVGVEAQRVSNEFRPRVGDAYLDGVRFTDANPDLDWSAAHRAAAERYPDGYWKGGHVTIMSIPEAFRRFVLFALECRPEESAHLYVDGKPAPRFFSPENLDALVGQGPRAEMREALLEISAALGFDLNAMEHNRDEVETARIANERRRQERARARMAFRATGELHLGDLTASEAAELRTAFPARAVIRPRKAGAKPDGRVVQVPYARERKGFIEVAFEVLSRDPLRVDVSYWQAGEADLLPSGND